MTEFDLIRLHFASQPVKRRDVRVGIGDDAAVMRPPAGAELVMTSDVLVAGIHFFPYADAGGIGHKSLAVNLSDLAAMGAEPAWFLLDLTLPEPDPTWLEGFSQGMYALARRHNVQLVGGDTVRGPLAIAITAIGFVPEGKALLRTGARTGDRICVTGTVGDAALALAQQRGERVLSAAEAAAVAQRLERPTPRTAEGLALRELATSAIDISDGLLADLTHILEESGVGARVRRDTVPLSDIYRRHLPDIGWDYALAGGDDYELCFTVPPANLLAVEALARQLQVPITVIGEITPSRALEVYDAAGRPYLPTVSGHDHFAPP
jgi:thiamine-monophosphate kinase